jgi:hypothetical protein
MSEILQYLEMSRSVLGTILRLHILPILWIYLHNNHHLKRERERERERERTQLLVGHRKKKELFLPKIFILRSEKGLFPFGPV